MGTNMLGDLSDVSEGIEGACTGSPDFSVSPLSDDLCLTATSPDYLQTMLHRLKAYDRRKR
eukprot:1160763-Pelagomonas_calceolata.AAC.15